MTFFLLLTCYKGQEGGCSEGAAVQGAQQRREQGSPPRRVTDGEGGWGRGEAVYLEVMAVHRKVRFPREPGEVDSPGGDAALGSACSGSCNPACTSRVVSSQQGALRQLTGL